MKTLTMIAATMCATVLVAQEAAPELAEQEDSSANWRLTVGGFGRGNLRTKMKGGSTDREQVWGADMDLLFNVWENEGFGLWAGIGGSFCPRQDVFSKHGADVRQQHDVSDDGFATYDFNYSSSVAREVELGYGEFRMMLVPEWKATESLSLGARVGVAFDWMRARCKSASSWAWTSSFVTDIPGVAQETDNDFDTGYDRDYDSVTEFAAQAIIGIQATYLLADNLGLYASCDWRIGGDTTFKTDSGDKFDVDMSGWCASAGLVLQF